MYFLKKNYLYNLTYLNMLFFLSFFLYLLFIFLPVNHCLICFFVPYLPFTLVLFPRCWNKGLHYYIFLKTGIQYISSSVMENVTSLPILRLGRLLWFHLCLFIKKKKIQLNFWHFHMDPFINVQLSAPGQWFHIISIISLSLSVFH